MNFKEERSGWRYTSRCHPKVVTLAEITEAVDVEIAEDQGLALGEPVKGQQEGTASVC